MRNHLTFCAVFFATAALSQADTIAVGVAGNSTFSIPTLPTSVGTLVNFDNLTQSTASVASVSTGGVTVASSDGVKVLPYSSMSFPNYIFDASSNGTANLKVTLSAASNKIGIGVADSDGVSITLQALGANGLALGSVFTENLNNTNDANGDSYFIVSDTSFDLYGLTVVQTTGNANYSGLALDDVQFAAATPEPSAFVLLGFGITLVGGLRLHTKN